MEENYLKQLIEVRKIKSKDLLRCFRAHLMLKSSIEDIYEHAILFLHNDLEIASFSIATEELQRRYPGQDLKSLHIL